MFKEEKGITLVALVITIIVLLILAGVSIALVVGNNGILGRATGAVDTTEIATAKQEVQLAIADAQVKYYADMASGTTATRSGSFGNASNNVFLTTQNCKTAKTVVYTPATESADGSLVYTTKSGIVITFTIKASIFDYEIASATDANGDPITVTKN